MGVPGEGAGAGAGAGAGGVSAYSLIFHSFVQKNKAIPPNFG